MKLFAVLILAVVAVNAHVRFENNAITSRNGDTFSVNTDGCGGTSAFGSAGVNDVTAGDALSYTFNYGTDTNGDHGNAGNLFTGRWLCAANTADLSAANLVANAQPIGNTVASPGGSQPGGYTMSFTVPIDAEGTCTYQVLDQRQWGGCQDYNVAAAPTSSSSSSSNGNGKTNEGNNNGDSDESASEGGLPMSTTALGGIIAGVAVIGAAAGFFVYQRSQAAGSAGYSAGASAYNAGPSSYASSGPNSYAAPSAPNSYAPSSQGPPSYAPSSYGQQAAPYSQQAAPYSGGQNNWNQNARY